jgi:hypothetical protein
MRTLLGLSLIFMSLVLLEPRDCAKISFSSSSTSSNENIRHSAAKVNGPSLAREALLLVTSFVTVLAEAVGIGEVGGCVLGPLLSPELFDWGKSAGDAWLTESSFCKNCFKRVFLEILGFLIAFWS